MRTLVIIGGGNMGGAIARAGAAGGARVVVAEPDGAARAALAAAGCEVAPDVASALVAAGGPGSGEGAGTGTGMIIVLAVKPQMFETVAAEIGGLGGGLVVSIMAGVGTRRIAAALGGGAGVRIVRAMPNLPLTLGLGMTALCAGIGSSEGDVESAAALFPGETMRIDEGLMDAFTALAGSGPAYLFYLAEAMERAGVEVGFTAEQARAIVRQTIVGAAAMMKESGEPPAQLRGRVTSRGGTTAAATSAMDSAGVMEGIVRGVIAARDRGREM